MICKICQSKGEVFCDKCNGIGEILETGEWRVCSECGGSGMLLCEVCFGEGVIEEEYVEEEENDN